MIGGPFALRVDVNELRQVGFEWAKAPEALLKRLANAIDETAAVGQAEARLGAPVFTGELANSIQIRAAQLVASPPALLMRGEVVTNVAHGVVMEEGRRPGARQPPFGPIRRWVYLLVRRGRMDVRWTGEKDEQDQIDSAAFVIARSIGRKGISPRRFMAKAAEKIEPLLHARVQGVMEWFAGFLEGGPR